MKLFDILFAFKGRMNRAKYWTIHLLMVIVGIVVFFICSAINHTAVGVFLLLYVVFGTWIGLAVNVKRWHDLDKSGWSELIRLMPFFELGFHRGTVGPNRFGPDPLEHA